MKVSIRKRKATKHHKKDLQSNLFSRYLILLVLFLSFPEVSSFLHPFASTISNQSFVYRNSNSDINRNKLSFSPPTTVLTMSLRAWTCHGRSQREMVDKLGLAGIIKSAPVREALLRVDRANYVENPANAHMDAPQSIGFAQTISAPHMHATAIEEMLPTLTRFSRELEQTKIMASKEESDDSMAKAGEESRLKILDVGCGSGFLTAALGRLVDRGSQGPIHPLSKGRVWGIEVIPDLVNLSRQNIMKADADLFSSGTVSVAKGDGWNGLPDEGPFHAIHVGAAAETFPPALMMQLNPHGGVMIIPVGANNSVQNLYKVERLRDNDHYNRDDFRIQTLLGVRYVPLVQSSKMP